MTEQDPETEARLKKIEHEWDERFERMQTPEFRKGVDFIFNATPEELQEVIATQKNTTESA